MSEPYKKTYRPWEPQRYRHEAHSPDTKLSAGERVFFVLETVPKLDWRRFSTPYEDETRGAPPCDPAMMVCLVLYAYCVGVFSSRKSAQPFGPSAIFASGLWPPFLMCACTGCGERVRQG